MVSLPARAFFCFLAIGALMAFACGGGGGGGEKSSTELLVIDQNILHGIIDEDPDAEPFDRFPERIELFADAFSDEQPDVVMLQEVVGNPGEDYPNVRERLLEALGPEYNAVFGNFLGGPIDEPGLGQMTLTRLGIVSSENRTVSTIRSTHHVAVDTDFGPLDVYNVHLEGTGAVLETDPAAATAEIDNVIAFIEETRSGTGPVILAGDFNAEPGDPSIQRLLDAGFIDVIAEAGDAICEKAGDPGCTNSAIPLGELGSRADKRIDYIFVLPGEETGIEVKEARVFLNEPVDIGEGRVLWASDHIGVLARLELVTRD